MSERIGYSIKEFARASSLGRSTVYDLLRSKELKARKVRKRTIIPESEARRWLSRLPSFEPDETK
jgi:excisionase family DNA binding protein